MCMSWVRMKNEKCGMQDDILFFHSAFFIFHFLSQVGGKKRNVINTNVGMRIIVE